jgi:hypothetical protein
VDEELAPREQQHDEDDDTEQSDIEAEQYPQSVHPPRLCYASLLSPFVFRPSTTDNVLHAGAKAENSMALMLCVVIVAIRFPPTSHRQRPPRRAEAENSMSGGQRSIA